MYGQILVEIVIPKGEAVFEKTDGLFFVKVKWEVFRFSLDIFVQRY